MLGDVGGLNDFIMLIFAIIIGFFSENLMMRSLIEKLYFIQAGKTGKQAKGVGHQPLDLLKNMKPLKLGMATTLGFACGGGRCPGSKRKRYLYSKAQEKLDSKLDVMTLVNSNRYLSTLLRLYLSMNERRLMRFQRRETVIESKSTYKVKKSLAKGYEVSSDESIKGKDLLK